MATVSPQSLREALAEVLRPYPVVKYAGVMAFLQAHAEDAQRLFAMAKSAGQDEFLFGTDGLPAIERFLDERTWPSLVEMLAGAVEKDGFRQSWVEFSYQLSLFRKVLPGEYITSMLARALETEAWRFFMPGELVKFFAFAEEVVKIIKRRGIRIIYAVDKSGRILGFLTHAVLRELKLSGAVTCYFLHHQVGVGVTFYDARQKAEVKDTPVLVIDEYAASGSTLRDVALAIDRLGGEPFTLAFAAASPRDFACVSSLMPSWYGREEYAGVEAAPHGLVKVDKGSAAIARAVRNALARLAPIIAEYIRVRGG